MIASADPNELDLLQLAFHEELRTDRRAAAETAYALASKYRDCDVEGTRRFDLAMLWASRSVDLLEQLPSDSLSEVASTRESVAGVPIPGLFHAAIVYERLGDVLSTGDVDYKRPLTTPTM